MIHFKCLIIHVMSKNNKNNQFILSSNYFDILFKKISKVDSQIINIQPIKKSLSYALNYNYRFEQPVRRHPSIHKLHHSHTYV